MEIITYDCKAQKNKKIIVYGIGEMGYITSRCLQELNVPVYHYADRKDSYHALFGNVISVDKMLEICEMEDVIILFAVMNVARNEAEYLSRRGIKRIYSVRKLWEEAQFYNWEWDESCQKIIRDMDKLFFTEDTIAEPQKLYFYTLDAVVTERCSLKCKDCANLMQYYQHPQDKDVYEIKKNIDKLLHMDCRIFDLRILGGEPLMNKEFVRLVDWYKDEEKIERISIYSNATIFPADGILEHLKVHNVWIRLSDYGNLSYKLKEWIQWCTENNVKYEVVRMDRWQDCGKLERHDCCEQELWGIYSECDCRNLPTILGGYLYNCPYAANAANLEAMTFDEINRDRLLLTDHVREEDVDKFLYERKYLEACRYCRGRNSKTEIAPCIQTRHPLEYKKLSDLRTIEPDTLNVETIEESELISVVIPVYNMEKYIERCLTSVLKSSYQKLEIIVVDDGSEDDTVMLCRRIAGQDALNRVKIIENEHTGVVKTRNTGIFAAKGKYITFVDADDYVGSERFAALVNAMDGCDLVHAGCTVVSEERFINDELMDRGQSGVKVRSWQVSEGVYESERIWPLIRRSFASFFNHSDFMGDNLWGCIYKTDIMKNICELVDPSIWYGEDIVLNQIYSSYCKKIRVINNLEYYYCLRRPQNRYPAEGIMENMDKAYHCLYNALKNHPQADLYKAILQEEYVELCFVGLRMQGITANVSIRNIYYPYYGRLKGKRVILYGAGNVGKAYYRHMKDDNECLLTAWVDKNAKKIREQDFLPVESVDCLYSKEYDYVVIAVFDEITYHAIYKELVRAGIREETIIWNPTKYEW